MGTKWVQSFAQGVKRGRLASNFLLSILGKGNWEVENTNDPDNIFPEKAGGEHLIIVGFRGLSGFDSRPCLEGARRRCG